MGFSRFLSMTIFIPDENMWHSEKPGQKPAHGRQWAPGETFGRWPSTPGEGGLIEKLKWRPWEVGQIRKPEEQALNFGKWQQQFLAFCCSKCIFQFKFPSLWQKNVYYGNCLECLSEIRALRTCDAPLLENLEKNWPELRELMHFSVFIFCP
jgi:hypothetical protein